MRQAAVAEPIFHLAIAPFPYGPAGVNTGQREDNAFYIATVSYTRRRLPTNREV